MFVPFKASCLLTEALSAEESFVLGFSEAEERARMVACVEKVVSAKQLKPRPEGQPNRIEPYWKKTC